MFTVISYVRYPNKITVSPIVSGLFKTESEAIELCKKFISSFTDSDIEYAGDNTWVINDKENSTGFKIVYQVVKIQNIK